MAVSALVSIHDVMPGTLVRVRAILRRLPTHISPSQVLLLVVPGRQWQTLEIEQLKEWQTQGFVLAGHGWSHQADKPVTAYHQLHSLLLSRNAAEHLSLDSEQAMALVEKNHQWFIDKGLKAPQWYIPPAWAMGELTQPQLKQLPFRYYEFLSGILDSKQMLFQRLPLLGYEADTLFRAICLRLFNRLNFLLAAWSGKPLRLSIHPHDFQFRLADCLDRDIRHITAMPFTESPVKSPSAPKHTEVEYVEK